MPLETFVMTNLNGSTTLSNSAGAYDATDALIAGHAGNFAAGEVARIKFIDDVSSAFVAGTLRFVAPAKGKQPDEGHHAEYAIDLWNKKRAARLAAKTGKQVEVRAVDGSRKSELKTILRATRLRKDIVSAAWKISDALAVSDAENFGKLRTYDAILRAAKAQTEADVVKAKYRLTDEDIRAAMSPKASETDEGKSLDAIIKKLGKMAEEFPENAKAYQAAAKALAPIVSILKGDAAREKFIADAVALGHKAEDAAKFYDTPRKAAA